MDSTTMCPNDPHIHILRTWFHCSARGVLLFVFHNIILGLRKESGSISYFMPLFNYFVSEIISDVMPWIWLLCSTCLIFVSYWMYCWSISISELFFVKVIYCIPFQSTLVNISANSTCEFINNIYICLQCLFSLGKKIKVLVYSVGGLTPDSKLYLCKELWKNPLSITYTAP